MFALVIIITFSLVITILDLSMLSLLGLISKLRSSRSPKVDRWIQDGVLQLQRRAYEAQGQGTWIRLDKDVPVTMDRVLLSDLPCKEKDTEIKAEQVQDSKLVEASPISGIDAEITVIPISGVDTDTTVIPTEQTPEGKENP